MMAMMTTDQSINQSINQLVFIRQKVGSTWHQLSHRSREDSEAEIIAESTDHCILTVTGPRLWNSLPISLRQIS